MSTLGPEQRANEPILFPTGTEYAADALLQTVRFHALAITTELDALLYSPQEPTQHRRLTAALHISGAKQGLAFAEIGPDEHRTMDIDELSNPYGASRFITSLLLAATERPVPNIPSLEREVRRNEKIAIATRDLALMSPDRRKTLEEAMHLNSLIGFSYELFDERDPRLNRPGKLITLLPKHLEY